MLERQSENPAPEPEKPRFTKVEFGPDSTKVEDFEGQVTENKEVVSETAYRQLNDFERKIVDKKIQQFQDSQEAQKIEPNKYYEIIDKLREDEAKKMIDLRKQNLERKAA